MGLIVLSVRYSGLGTKGNQLRGGVKERERKIRGNEVCLVVGYRDLFDRSLK